LTFNHHAHIVSHVRFVVKVIVKEISANIIEAGIMPKLMQKPFQEIAPIGSKVIKRVGEIAQGAIKPQSLVPYRRMRQPGTYALLLLRHHASRGSPLYAEPLLSCDSSSSSENSSGHCSSHGFTMTHASPLSISTRSIEYALPSSSPAATIDAPSRCAC
jgi:hypothetical protein